VGDITVRKNDLIHMMFGEESRKISFRVDGNPLWVVGPGEFRRISSMSDVGNLRGSKGNDLIGRTIPEEGIEIMKIPSSGPKDNDLDGFGL
jgi:hypothetical protein